ncbi:recombinase family protein [Peribacillus loiseleuriae]|uniref:recombinase family protein n=1 Tax=Peribacillus loiseleuriae TaxID=1679170 RepID=UPI003D02BCCC
MIFGYARVSSADQNLARQLKELKAFGCEKIYQEKQSGKDLSRPEYQKLRSILREGDILVVHDLSRFGRNKEDIRNEWKSMIDQNVDIVVLNMPILDTRKYKELEGVGQLVTDLVLTLLSWMVDEERNRIKTAQREGIQIAKEKGVYTGKKKMYHPGAKGKDKIVYDEVVRLLETGESVMNIHRKTGLSRNTIYRIKRDWNFALNDR